VGCVINIHGFNMYHYINTIKIESAIDNADKAGDGYEVNTSNISNVTEEHLSDVKKQ